MKKWIKKIKRDDHQDLDRSNYLRLDKNERVINFEKKLLEYIKKKINLYHLSAYPNLLKLKKIISKRLKVKNNNIFLSAGSDLSLKTCIEAFTNYNEKVLILKPTFGMVRVYCDLYKLKTIEVGYNDKLELDIEKLYKNISNKLSLIILANPNSPTGTIVPKEIMIKIFKKAQKYKVPVVIDEAYEGFFDYSYYRYTKNYQNLVILRTFSKSFGLAGLRAGFAISNSKNIDLLNKFRPMYEINSIAVLVIEFLYKNYDIVLNHISETSKAKKFLKIRLSSLGLKYIDTYANFIHLELDRNHKILEKKFLENGVLFRKGPGVKGFEKYIRLSLGSVNQMKKAFRIIKSIHEKKL